MHLSCLIIRYNLYSFPQGEGWYSLKGRNYTQWQHTKNNHCSKVHNSMSERNRVQILTQYDLHKYKYRMLLDKPQKKYWTIHIKKRYYCVYVVDWSAHDFGNFNIYTFYCFQLWARDLGSYLMVLRNSPGSVLRSWSLWCLVDHVVL